MDTKPVSFSPSYYYQIVQLEFLLRVVSFIKFHLFQEGCFNNIPHRIIKYVFILLIAEEEYPVQDENQYDSTDGEENDVAVVQPLGFPQLGSNDMQEERNLLENNIKKRMMSGNRMSHMFRDRRGFGADRMSHLFRDRKSFGADRMSHMFRDRKSFGTDRMSHMFRDRRGFGNDRMNHMFRDRKAAFGQDRMSHMFRD